MKKLIGLAIESTAHTFSISLLNNSKLIKEKQPMYTKEQGGIIPVEAAEHHNKVKDILLKDLLYQTKISWSDIDFITISSGPGLAPSLSVGTRFAKELAIKHKKPIIGVNHLCAHLEIGKLLTPAKDPVFVFVSGANTQIIAHEGGKYRVFGETLSSGLGNALDKFGRSIGLGFPAGPKIEQLAKNGKYIELPYTVKGMDIEPSGIITAAIQKFKKGEKIEDLCFSIQETLFSMLVEVTERALAHTQKKEALLIGGVAANKRLIQMLETMCKERSNKFYFVPIEYSGDNSYMIGYLGLLSYKAGLKDDPKTLDFNPNWRIDQLETPWIK